MSTLGPGAALRAEAARVLVAVLDDGRSLKAVLSAALPKIADPRDRGLLEAIVFAALRHERRYTFVLSRWLTRPLPVGTAKDRAVARLLLVGLAQLDALGMAPHAAVGATVDAVKQLGREGLAGLFNAVLRKATREPWAVPDSRAVRTSHPDWMVRRFEADWPERVDALLEANNTEAPLWLRANAPRVGREALAARWSEAGIASESGPARDGLRVLERANPTQLPGFDDGAFHVQDLAAQLAVEALGPLQGQRVLDACAAPGGKTLGLMSAVGDGGEVLALDVDAKRLERVRSLVQAVSPSRARFEARAADAAEVGSWHDGRAFDAILLDAPCSATGILRRQPDIKAHRREDDIAVLAATQARLLEALWPLLTPGGVLLYATCSVLREENDQQVAAFLARHPDARLEPLDARFGYDTGHGTQRFPGEDGGDGFFYARLVRAG
ncbi:16S rRNA (cytosine(967)-C(5))-methyltransferase RsmB [Silanimonas sp.]|jgi:16S rRNA (cytosine967-C5)-methyltransferase|uniref:16S rRNA (cytosine(967)-C(5))-methyltransferase RsmB n=1 Tax=Silanimonas sp. TaxID=1929290 RepID=UPI0022BB3319|nr:16S rRNA (cytosine(967)-C(5))-methyltransferase RsmB [Silanimonas sp.]MCZ8061649.1 16S rRNA (cytosine(967)-C(5))-methyltransferase RsmB [Silanimonas sp.]